MLKSLLWFIFWFIVIVIVAGLLILWLYKKISMRDEEKGRGRSRGFWDELDHEMSNDVFDRQHDRDRGYYDAKHDDENRW